MQWIKIWMYIFLAFLTANGALGAAPVISVNISNNRTVIGGVTRLEIVVKSPKNTAVSWQLCDSIFKTSQQVVWLSSASSAHGDSFKHIVAFTSARQLKMALNGLTVVINGQKYLTPAFELNYKETRIPAQLNDIKAVAAVSWFSAVKSWLLFLLLLVILLGAIMATYFLSGNWVTNKLVLNDTKAGLEKLLALETAAEEQKISMLMLVDEVFEVLKTHADNRLTSPNAEMALNFHETASRLRFAPAPLAGILYPAFINDARALINGYQSASSK